MSAYDDAVARLDQTPATPYYNLLAKTGGNPGGMAADGHRTSLFAMIADLLTMAAGLLTKAAAAAQSASDAAASATSALNAPGTMATSTSSNSVASSGQKTWTIQTGKSLAPGQRISSARTSAPAAAVMYGAVNSYNSVNGQLVVDIDAAVGAGLGPFTDWSIAVSPTNVVQPSQAGAAGKFLKTDATNTSWAQPATTDLSDIAAYTAARRKKSLLYSLIF